MVESHPPSVVSQSARSSNTGVRIPALILSLLAVPFLGCDAKSASYRGEISKPEGAHINLSDQTLASFDGPLGETLFRYFAGNPRWEVREERGVRYAVRLQRVNDKFETTLNGFYWDHEGDVVRQTRLLVSLGREYGFGREYGNITRCKAGENDVAVIIEGNHAGTPGNSSYTIVAGNSVFLETYDQAPDVARAFIQKAFEDMSAELKDVIEHRKAIEQTGLLPVPERYPDPLPTKRSFELRNGIQPGIYLVEAAISPGSPGIAFVKAFNAKTGERLSETRMMPQTTRHVGWSENGTTLFPYKTEVTVYEGDWDSKYDARFELWHRSKDGLERKLAETTRAINGWQR
jgi:hypothetical protein